MVGLGGLIPKTIPGPGVLALVCGAFCGRLSGSLWLACVLACPNGKKPVVGACKGLKNFFLIF